MDLSVIIVSYKGWNRLTSCLESLKKISGNRFTMEVIVVDNNSGDNYFETIEKTFPGFRFIRNKVNGGYANGCNLGFANSSGEAVLILNPDTIVNEDAISVMLDAVRKNQSYYIVSCRQVRNNGSESRAAGKFPALFRSGKSSGFKDNDPQADYAGSVTFPDWVSGSVMMLRREIYLELNGFDEDFWMYSEDVDLCRRARDNGGEVAFLKGIVIEHNHGGSSRIDVITTAITKCEVQKSKHLYIHKHIKGPEGLLLHSIIIADNLITGLIAGIAGLLMFFIPKLFVRFHLFIRLITYYAGSMAGRSWISTRSVNFKKH